MTDWVSVPKEPTREMLSALAGHPALLAASVEESAREAYKALLSAAPAATEKSHDEMSVAELQQLRSRIEYAIRLRVLGDPVGGVVFPPLPGKEE